MSSSSGFIEKHGLWTDDQRAQAKEVIGRITKDGIKLVRVAWSDPHGVSRAKTVTAEAFLGALKNGYNINVATATLDASGARVFSSFTRGGGMGLDEMTGSPNLIIVPDPSTLSGFAVGAECRLDPVRRLLQSGRPFHFSPATRASKSNLSA